MLNNNLLNNRYQVLRIIGTGGCGQTYLAEDTHLPSRRLCVVKILKPATPDINAQHIISQRFHREAAILETLGRSCKQIPVLYAHFAEDNEFYLVQEWIDGRNLLEKVSEEGVFSENQVVGSTQLLSILNFTHSEGIIHRDIKPENIMVDAAGVFFLIDFGAVKEVMTTMVYSYGTPTGSIIIGSQGYMPFEQATGRPVFASDLYCLGLTAIFLLTGKSPQELVNLSSGEIDWKPLVPSLNPNLIKVLETAIKHNYADRFRSAQEMLDALIQKSNPQSEVVTEYIRVDPTARNFAEVDTFAKKPAEDDTIVVISPPPVKPAFDLKSIFSVSAIVVLVFALLAMGIAGAWYISETNRIRREAEANARLKQQELDIAKQNQLEEQRKREELEKKKQEEEKKRLELEKMQPRGEIEKVWVDHDQFKDGRKGMLIHTKFSVHNVQSVSCNIAAFFYYEDGTPLKDSNDDYKTTDGKVAVGQNFTPNNVDSDYSDYQLFIPIEELHMDSGEHKLKFQVQIRQQIGDKLFDSSEYYLFTYTSK